MSEIEQQENQESSQDVTENVQGVVPIQEQPTAEQVDSVENQPNEQAENVDNNPLDSEAPSEAKSDYPPNEVVQDPVIPQQQEEQVQEPADPPPQVVQQAPPKPEYQVPQQPQQEQNPLPPPANTIDTSNGSQGAGGKPLVVTPQVENQAPVETAPAAENQEDQMPAVIQEEEENNENSQEQMPMEEQQEQSADNIPENQAEEQARMQRQQQEIDAINMQEDQNVEEDVDQDHHHEQMQQQLYEEEQRLREAQSLEQQEEYERNQREFEQNMQYDLYAQQSEEQPMYYIDDNIAKRVEQEKLDKIYYDSHNLKQLLVIEEGRCEICTLMPPCKHHSSARVQEGHEDIQDQLQMYSNSELQSQMKGGTEISMGGSTAHKTHDHIVPPQREIQSMEQMENERTDNLMVGTSDDSSPRKSIKMGRTLAALNSDRISPYSILCNSDQVEVQSAIQKLKEQAVIAQHGGKRSTRTEILRQLALQQKIAKNPFLQKESKMSKQETDKLAMDPLINDQSLRPPQVQSQPKQQSARMRNKHGHYQSIDVTASRGQSLTAYGSSRNSHFEFNETDINKAEHRLRVIEKISKYREEKIKREFLKLEEELRIENDGNQKKMRKEQRMQMYHNKQRERLAEYQKYKALKHQAEQEEKLKMEQHKSILNDMRIIRNEENKAKLKAYKQMKAQQILEIQRMEQEQRIMLVRSKAQMARNKFNYSFDLQYQQRRHNRSKRKNKQIGRSVDFRTIQPADRYNMDEQNEELENGIEVNSATNGGSPFGQKNSKQFRNNLTWGNKQNNYVDNEAEKDQQVNLKIQLNNTSEVGIGKTSRTDQNGKQGHRSHNLSVGYYSPGENSPAKSINSQFKLQQQHNNIQMKQKLTKMEEKEIRETLNMKLQKSENEDSMKQMRYKGGKVLYKSIEKPLKLYSHGMRVVDITNPNNQKVMKNRYVQNYNPKYQIGVMQQPEVFVETNQQNLKKQIFKARQQQKMAVEPYANVPYRTSQSKSKLGVQYPKNIVPVKPLREMQMEDPNAMGKPPGPSSILQERKVIQEENQEKIRKEEQVLENVANPQMFDSHVANGVSSPSAEQTQAVEQPVPEVDENPVAPQQEQNVENVAAEI